MCNLYFCVYCMDGPNVCIHTYVNTGCDGKEPLHHELLMYVCMYVRTRNCCSRLQYCCTSCKFFFLQSSLVCKRLVHATCTLSNSGQTLQRLLSTLSLPAGAAAVQSTGLRLGFHVCARNPDRILDRYLVNDLFFCFARTMFL